MTEKQKLFDLRKLPWVDVIEIRVKYRVSWKGNFDGRRDAIEAALQLPIALTGNGPDGSYQVERLPGAEVIEP
jgi:hypothetical protein